MLDSKVVKSDSKKSSLFVTHTVEKMKRSKKRMRKIYVATHLKTDWNKKRGEESLLKDALNCE